MVLYKATKDGNVEMTKDEEAQIRADWSKSEANKDKPRTKTLEERVEALEAAILGKK